MSLGSSLTTGMVSARAQYHARACFAGGTPIRLADGCDRTWKPIEEILVGDRVLSRHEDDPDGPAVAQVVEEIFVRVAPILQLTIAGRIIATTAEHPFYVRDRGWTPAGELQAGDQLASLDGSWLAVDSLTDSGLLTTVYNFRVSDYHTYFVGTDDWAFAVWAHHASYETRLQNAAREKA